MHAHRDEVDAVAFDQVVGNVGGGIGDDDDALGVAVVRGCLLHAHVVGFL